MAKKSFYSNKKKLNAIVDKETAAKFKVLYKALKITQKDAMELLVLNCIENPDVLKTAIKKFIFKE